MSIWHTVWHADLPQRDRYTGEVQPGLDPDRVAVCVSPSWHSLVRLSTDDQPLLTVDEARSLIAGLTEAIARIERDD